MIYATEEIDKFVLSANPFRGPYGNYQELTFFKTNDSLNTTPFMGKLVQTICNSRNDEVKTALLYMFQRRFRMSLHQVIHKISQWCQKNDLEILQDLHYQIERIRKPQSGQWSKQKIESMMELVNYSLVQSNQTTLGNVLDLGAGDGFWLKHLIKGNKASHGYGVEVETWMGQEHKNIKNKNIDFVFIDPEQPKFSNIPDQSIQTVFCMYSLHHIGNLLPILHELKRVMAPNAQIIIVEHDVQNAEEAMSIDFYHAIQFFQDHQRLPTPTEYFSRFYNCWTWDQILGKILNVSLKSRAFGSQWGPGNIYYLKSYNAIYQ